LFDEIDAQDLLKGSHLERSRTHTRPIVRIWPVEAKAAEVQPILRQLGLFGGVDISLPYSEETFR
jgi:hypothetical protein